MFEIFYDALKDTFAIIPWLLGIYVFLELIEGKASFFAAQKISHKKSLAPLIAAILGCFPQCGFSVIASALYAKRCISLGTLLAVFISTSDEAFPVILADGHALLLIFQIIIVKIIAATFFGLLIDVFVKKYPAEAHAPHDTAQSQTGHQHCSCHHHDHGEPKWKTFFLFPLKHSLNIILFIFLTTSALNFLFSMASEETLNKIFFTGSIFQPLFTILVGLIPNCGASVIITELYLKGSITFGSALAGLCAGSGLGILVLFKENKNKKEVFFILGLLTFCSLLVGIFLNIF